MSQPILPSDAAVSAFLSNHVYGKTETGDTLLDATEVLAV